MPSQGRIDAPGAVHEIAIREIERRAIFEDGKEPGGSWGFSQRRLNVDRSAVRRAAKKAEKDKELGAAGG